MLTGIAAAATLALVTVAPAFADTQTTVTTSSVTADRAIEIPYDYDVWDDASYFVEGGPVAFPLPAEQYDGTYTQNTFAMSPSTVPAGCVRTVDSFTFGYSLGTFPKEGTFGFMGGVGTGDPLVLATVAADGVTLLGDGEVDSIDSGTGTDRVWLSLPSFDSDTLQSGVVTLAFPTPVSAAEARGYIGFDMPWATDWVVDHTSFGVTDTCTGPAPGPTTTTPAIVRPVSVETGIAAVLPR